MTRILLVKLSAIGDVIHCLPLVARLKENLPDCQLHWLVEPAAAPLLFNNPLVDKVFVLPKKEFLAGFKSRKPSAVLASLSTMAHFIKALKRESYDLAIDAQGLFKSAALARLSGAKKVVGFKGTRESAEHWLTDSLDVGDYFAPDCHVVDLNLALADFALRTTGGAKPPSDNLPRDHTLVCFPLPAVTESERGKIEKLLGSFAASSPAVQPLPKPSSADIIQPADVAPYMATKEKPLIVLIPGTTWDTKIWPAQSWIELACRFQKELDAGIILVGGPSERAANLHIYKGIEAAAGRPHLLADITGETNLIDLLALFERTTLVIGADTGPMHLACAAAAGGGPAVLAVHGASPWGRNGPYGPAGRVAACHLELACQPCFSKHCRLGTIECMKDLPVGKVFQMAISLIAL